MVVASLCTLQVVQRQHLHRRLTAHGLIRLASIHPTHITEVVGPDLPHFYGYVDFAACGMGGVLLPCTRWVQPLVWRLPCPHDIKTACETQGGYINNNDGEAAAVCVQEMSLEHWTGLDTAGLSLHTGSRKLPGPTKEELRHIIRGPKAAT